VKIRYMIRETPDVCNDPRDVDKEIVEFCELSGRTELYVSRVEEPHSCVSCCGTSSQERALSFKLTKRLAFD